jgi:hypothetical protein
VKLEAVVNRGVTFWLKLMFGLIVPAAMIFAPVEADVTPMEAWVNVPVLVEVFCGKSMFATGDTELLVTTQPPVVRATLIRVY